MNMLLDQRAAKVELEAILERATPVSLRDRHAGQNSQYYHTFHVGLAAPS